MGDRDPPLNLPPSRPNHFHSAESLGHSPLSLFISRASLFHSPENLVHSRKRLRGSPGSLGAILAPPRLREAPAAFLDEPGAGSGRAARLGLDRATFFGSWTFFVGKLFPGIPAVAERPRRLAGDHVPGKATPRESVPAGTAEVLEIYRRPFPASFQDARSYGRPPPGTVCRANFRGRSATNPALPIKNVEGPTIRGRLAPAWRVATRYRQTVTRTTR